MQLLRHDNGLEERHLFTAASKVSVRGASPCFLCYSDERNIRELETFPHLHAIQQTLLQYQRIFESHGFHAGHAAWFLPVSVAFYLNRTVVKKIVTILQKNGPYVSNFELDKTSSEMNHCYIEIQYFHLRYTPNLVRRRILSKIWTMNERPFRFCS